MYVKAPGAVPLTVRLIEPFAAAHVVGSTTVLLRVGEGRIETATEPVMTAVQPPTVPVATTV